MKGRRAPVPTEDVIGLIGTAVYTRVVCIETDEQGRVATNRNRLSLLSDGNEKWPVVCKRPPGKGLWSAIGFEPTACGSETILWIKSGTTDEAITIDRAIDVRACGGPVTIGLQPSVGWPLAIVLAVLQSRRRKVRWLTEIDWPFGRSAMSPVAS